MTFRLNLSPSVFTDTGFTVLDHPDWQVTAFCYATGIKALRIKGPRSEAVVLPFRGQQVWQLSFDGAPVGMRGMTAEPAAGSGLLDSFGAFFFHCGLMGTAGPGPTDDHAIHGELPVAAMQAAWIELPADGTLVVGGRFDFAKAFRAHYRAEPYVRFHPGKPEVAIGIKVTNLGHAPMPFMYLGHPNFRPVDGATLAYSARYSAETVRVRDSFPAHMPANPALASRIAQLKSDPTPHHVLRPGQAYDPEVVFQIDYAADAAGWAHSLQIHPDGSADSVSHQIASCPRALRWIARSPDMDAIAIVEPTTSWLGGFTAERAAGHVPVLAQGAEWQTEIRVARLNAQQAADRLALIDKIAGR